jgi:hypothetical protein
MCFVAGDGKPWCVQTCTEALHCLADMPPEQDWRQGALVTRVRFRCRDVQDAGGARSMDACMRA